MAPIQLQANGRSGLTSDRRTTEDQYADDEFSSAHHSRVPDTNLAVAALRQVHVAAAGVVLADVHHVRLHTSTFQRPGAKAIRSQHARASAKNPLPRVHRARCAWWVEYYLAHAHSTAAVVDTDLRGARTGYQNAGKLPCLRLDGNVCTRRARSCKHRTPGRRAQAKHRRTALPARSSLAGKR